jgi:hypothetical protein
MNILELDSYNLADAVKFNDHLNPRIWGKDEHLRPEVRERLLLIAEDFKETLGVKDLDLKDITVSGSNAAYTYTPNSDIDLHLVVDMPENPVYRELFDAKKFQYNETHNIKIGGFDVELYVQAADQPHYSQGIYSVLRNEWIQVPRRVKSTVDDASTRNKFETIGHQIEAAVKSGESKQLERIAAKVKKMRQTGLEQHGEFGPENLAFKMLRSQGVLQKLHDARADARSRELSLRERRKPGSVFTYGFRHEDEQAAEPVVTAEAKEKAMPTDEEILRNFIDFCAKELKLDELPTIKLRRDPQWPVMHKTFGRYINDRKMLEVAWGNRHIMDVLRTVAHELTHRHQHERDGSRMGPDAGKTGSPYENEANARAGVLMRDYARLHPEFFEAGQSNELHIDEGARSAAAAAAVVAALAGGPVTAQAQSILGTIRDVGTAVRQAQNITRAGLNDEVQQEIRNFIRAQGGDPGSQNLSRLYQLQRELQSQEPDAGTIPGYVQQDNPATNESASGYIPTKKQAKDPRYIMALTQDIRPGQLGKEANKLKLKTDRQGHPQVAQANGLFEELPLQLEAFKRAQEDYSADAPPGPEFKPTMPAGTLRVDVTDMYDWYKMGQHISNMKGLGKHDFGQGPPGSIISFGDEDTEHKFIGDLKATGLDVTDIDPKDPKKRPGKKIKTDPTYNVNESETLDEVKMSPSALQKWANSPDAQGIRAGFEAELIFRDTNNNGDSDYEMEPDYDADERCRSIQDIIDFFSGGDYGNLSPRQERALQEALDEQYYEWYDEQMHKDFREEAEDLIRKVMVDEGDWDLDNEIQKQLELLDLTDDEMNAIINAGERAPKFTSSKEQILYAEANPLYQKYLDAQEEAEGLLDDLIQDEVRKQGANWDAALDDFRDNYQIDDDSGFFDDVGLRWMSDVANNYDLDWPYMTGGGGNDGSRDWDSIGDSLHNAVDMPVKVSSNYHQAVRKEGQWIVEPDTSLEPDDREDFGLEIVSPPLPLEQALEKLQAVTDWANDSSEGNAYTNSSTGLHMGVSVPFKGGDVDYLKLILFLGDEYVLKSFGREANTYCKSAMSKFKENIKGGRADPMGVIKLMQSGLLELAHKEIQKGVGDGKYTSAHIQKGYIEFRSPGGDWLAEESADPAKLQSTMLRFARAMSLAANPAEERREYAKKLYKLVAPEGDSQLALFSQFASGELTAEQLKKQWAEKTIGTEKKMNQRWRLYQNVNGRWEPVPGAEWNGYPEDEVKMRVWSKYGREALDSGEYQLVNMGEQDWEVYDVKTGKTLEIVKGKSKGEVADAVYDKYVDQGIGFQVRPWEDPAKMTPRAKLAKRIAQTKKPTEYNYEIVNLGDVNLGVVDQFYAANKQEADKTFDKWLTMKGLPNDTDTYGYRPRKQETVKDVEPDVAQNFAQPQNATDRVGSWAIYDVTLGREISRMTDVPWQQASNRADELERSTGHNMSVRGLSENFANNLSETLPAKNLNQLYNIKKQLANPAFSTAEPKPAEKPVPARPAQPRVHAALTDLQRQRDKVQQIMDLKQEIETLTARAGRTRYGITPGLSADIEDIYPNPATEADMDAAIQGYEVQKKKLADYIARQRKVFPKEDVAEGQYDANPATYNLPRRPLNVPELIKRGAIFVVDPHGENGWEPDAEGFSLVTLWNVAKGGWPAEARQHLKPSMYKAAESGLNRQGPGSMLYDGKYNQILWSIKKLGIPDEVAFLDQVKENFADGKKPGRKGLAKRVGVPTKASVSKLRQIAKHSTGEKARMAHWMANMKAGKQKKNESEMDEGWKQNVAAGVLGAGMALGGGTAQADTDVFNKKFTPAEIQQLQTKAELTQRYYNELVRRAKEDGRIMDRTTLNMLKAQAEDAAARSVQQRPQAPQAKSALPGTQSSEIRRSKNYNNFESVSRKIK